LFLDRHDLHDLILQFVFQKVINNFGFLKLLNSLSFLIKLINNYYQRWVKKMVVVEVTEVDSVVVVVKAVVDVMVVVDEEVVVEADVAEVDVVEVMTMSGFLSPNSVV